MKSAISLLLLLLLIIHQAHGMGVTRKGSLSHRSSQQVMSHKTLEEKTDKDVDKSVWESKNLSGRARKLMITPSIPTTATVAKNEKSTNKKTSATKVNSSSMAEQRMAADETYPGILDIAGMDYSQARRKPPIHN
ncbi:hypothetical protein SASPL_128521 [Salvia splendens]|uniref:Uncharacterized protein n=1 Tax=Salvia splendens TaxID=180675 RepID=A0A8X8X9N9_SALSN|nr:uncharacterized protein LOC121751147 [Salvia splendens]KAG6410460.1 hypothetical protein SASPL_128521 [Salvia splendens]